MPISVLNMVSEQSILASGTYTTQGININQVVKNGYFSAELLTTGTGTVKVEYLLSYDGVNYVNPTGHTDVFSGFTAGRGIASFTPAAAPYIAFLITETGGVNPVVASLKLAVN